MQAKLNSSPLSERNQITCWLEQDNSDFHLFIFSINRLAWRGCLGWKGVKNTVKEISFPPFFLWIVTFAFFNFLNWDSVNCHRAPQHLLRHLRNWLFLQITLISDLVSATKGLGEGGRLSVWPCPSPRWAFSPLKFTVIYLMCRHAPKPRHAVITNRKTPVSPRRETTLGLARDGPRPNFRASRYPFRKEGDIW